MGTKKGGKKNVDSFDDRSYLELLLDTLYERRRTAREKALSSIIQAFTSEVQYEFAEKQCATMVERCLQSIKRGGGKEISLASHLLGLLSLTNGAGDHASDVLNECFTPISKALSSTSEVSKLLECLAMITFVGGSEPEETERAMQIIWQFIHQKAGSNVCRSPAVIASAIHAWSFLLTTMFRWSTINSTSWLELVSHFSSLAEAGDRSVRIAAGEALALLFEIKNDSGDAIQELKLKILDQVEALSIEAGGRGISKENLINQRNCFRDIYEYFQNHSCPETSTKIANDLLHTSTWSELVQLNFLKRFLGSGFFSHMKENELLHDVFEFKPQQNHISGKPRKLSTTQKRMYKSPNSNVEKERSRSLRKQRALFQRNIAHCVFHDDDI